MGNDGSGVLIDTANLSKVRSVRLSSFTMEQFRWMCMLSGCDYLPSIKGMGLIKAFKFLQRHKAVKQVIKALRIDKTHTVPPDYEENFRKAEIVFKFQRVFDIKKRCCVHLRDPAEESMQLNQDDFSYAGPLINQPKALAIALGNIDPMSGKIIGSLSDFASGDVAFGNVQNVQKSTSWMTTSTNFKVREPRTRAINKEISSQESATTSPDLMPPSSDGLQSQDDCPTKKSLFTSPKACAIKSLKRLSSELSEENSSSSESNWKKIYSEPPSKKYNSSSSHHGAFGGRINRFNPFFKHTQNDDVPENTIVKSRYFSGSVETKVTSQENNDDPPNTPPDKIKEQSTSSPIITSTSPGSKFNGSFIDYLDTKNCRASSSTNHPGNRTRKLTLNKSSPKSTIQQAKIDFKAKENIHLTIKCENEHTEQSSPTSRKPLSPVIKTASNSKKRNEKKETIDFEIDVQRAESNKSDIITKPEKALFYIEDDEEECKENVEILCENTITDNEDSDSPSTPRLQRHSELDSDEGNYENSDTSSTDKELQKRLSEGQLENTDNIHKSRNSKQSYDKIGDDDVCISSQEEGVTGSAGKKTLKIGLNRRHCNGRGASSFLASSSKKQSDQHSPKSQNKITQMLEKFKNIPKIDTSPVQPQISCTSLVEDLMDQIVDLRDESLLTPAEKSSMLGSLSSPTLFQTKVSSTTKTAKSLSYSNNNNRRCKPIGLSRNKKKSSVGGSLPSMTTGDGLKQSKLSFNKFAFQKKGVLSKEDDDGEEVICLD